MRALFVVLALWPTLAFGQARLCEMPREDAEISQICVRWYAVCCMDSTMLSDETEKLPYQERLNIQARACFALAERNCLYFDYEAAKAALDSRLR